MKWYFACNDKSQNIYPLIEGAVNSVLQNTTLEPHFIYDGEENELTEWLRQKSVKIIHHRVSFYDALEKYYTKDSLAVASGAFLRCDIPIIEKADNFVLYTDCDVLFLKEFKPEMYPKYFACSAQSNKRNFVDFNTGVMLINVKKTRESHKKFCKFIIENLGLLSAFDQTAYQIFYNRKNTKLPIIYNYKPYWCENKNAVIIHFHGCKPTTFASDEALKNLPYSLYELYKKNPSTYDFYLDLFKEYYPEIEYDKKALENLKNGIYPLIKPKRTPLSTRLINNFLKTRKKLEQYFSNQSARIKKKSSKMTSCRNKKYRLSDRCP